MHALILVLGLAGCERGQMIAGVQDSAFVAAMAELRRVQTDPSLDSTRRAAARQAVLQSRGLSPAALERAARALARDPERAAEIWRAIDRRAEELANPPEPPADDTGSGGTGTARPPGASGTSSAPAAASPPVG